MTKPKVLAVVGPTASGKTGLAIQLAKKYNGEVVSADSMQIYKGMNIATAKPDEAEMSGIKHHMMDIIDSDETYSVGQYVVDASKIIENILLRGKLPIVCGGTGLYVDSLLNGIDFIENSCNQKIRDELNLTAEKYGIDYLLDILSEFDTVSYEKLSKEKNCKRIIRAIEFYRVTGKTITQQNEDSLKNGSRYDHLIIGLTSLDRQYLYDRVNIRVENMLKQGLLSEVRQVLKSPLSETASKAIGYKELIPYINGESSLEDCIDRLKTDTRHYAKRQLTWFRKNQSINWINIDELNSTDRVFEYAVSIINKREILNG